MLPRARTIRFLAPLLAGAALPTPSRAQELGYEIRPGDRITVEVYTAAGARLDVVSGQRILDRRGDVFLPYVGTFHAAGLDETAMRERLVTAYERYYDQPVVNVKVELKVSITGAVRVPNQYWLDPTATISDALAAAGGANLEYAVTGSQAAADPSHVRLVRDGERLTLNLDPAQVTDEVLAMRIHSGDWIHVPPSTRTTVREQVLFWGSLVSFASSLVSLVVLLATR